MSDFWINQNNVYKVGFLLRDENDAVIPLASLGTLICTLYYYNPNLTTSDRYHLATINGRSDQNVKNANNVTVSNTGTVTWYMQPEDTAKLDSSTEKETHISLFTWMWDGKQNNEEIFFHVRKVNYAS